MNERGKIRNRDCAKQLRDFSGLIWGKITPTDIDCFIDFGNKLFIIIESKLKNTVIFLGQKLALERLCDACQKGGVSTYLLLAEHEESKEQDVDFSKIIVIECRHKKIWRKPKEIITLKDAIDKIREKENVK